MDRVRRLHAHIVLDLRVGRDQLGTERRARFEANGITELLAYLRRLDRGVSIFCGNLELPSLYL